MPSQHNFTGKPYDTTRSQHVGDVDDQIDLSVWVNKITPVASNFSNSPRNLYAFRSSEGNQYRYFGLLRGVNEGDHIDATAKIKENQVYKNERQTLLAEVSVR